MPFTVANVAASFNSESGGPPRTIALLGEAARGGWQSELYTTDFLAGNGDSSLAYTFPGEVTQLPAAQAGSLARMVASGLGAGFAKLPRWRARPPDILHVHGLWTPMLAGFAWAARRRGIPCVVTTHGMLEPWALAVRPRVKSLALRSYQGNVLAGAAALHATGEPEAANLRSLRCVRAPVHVIPNPVVEPDPAAADLAGPGAGRRVLLFLSRVHPKKGLDMLLEAWRRERPGGWRLRIVGSGAAPYVNRLMDYCREHALDDVEFHGHVDGLAWEGMFRSASAFILPTYSENFGNVVAEAMIRGLPVVTTTGTPWSVVATRKLGWYIEPAPVPLARCLRELAEASDDELRAMGRRGQELARATLSVDAVRGQLQALYESVLR
jgi:glycosyltransferase involved in cell wall biosynthesis